MKKQPLGKQASTIKVSVDNKVLVAALLALTLLFLTLSTYLLRQNQKIKKQSTNQTNPTASPTPTPTPIIRSHPSTPYKDIVELRDAFIRYYAHHGDLPWNEVYNCGGTRLPVDFGSGATPASINEISECIRLLQKGDFLENNFISALGGTANNIYISSKSPTDISVCYVTDENYECVD